MHVILENTPDVWRRRIPWPTSESHKYTRGAALVRGGSVMTGATRLAGRAAQRMGAGLVTLAVPQSALPIYAESLESIIVKSCETVSDWKHLIEDGKNPALLIGPGIGIGFQQCEEIITSLHAKRPTVVDADGITNFAAAPEKIFEALHDQCVLTPHEGEFEKLFGQSDDEKIKRTVNAAERARCIVLLKGAQTIIANPQGEVIVNHNAPPWLATAGSGDVLAGMILGLITQKMDIFLAAAAAAWIHGAIAARFGVGLIAEDIVAGIPAVLQEMISL